MKISLLIFFILGFSCLQCSTGKSTTSADQQKNTAKETNSTPQFISTSKNNGTPVDSAWIKKYSFTPPTKKRTLSKVSDTAVSAPANRIDQKGDMLSNPPKK